jgi:hydroxyacylglutathione hydrolase
MMEIEIIPCLYDNYSYIISDKESKKVAVIDPAEFDLIDKIIIKKYGRLDYILNTHHHLDHVGGNEDLRNKYKSKIFASKKDFKRIKNIDVTLEDGDIFNFGKTLFKIMYVPGHTLGHIAFYSPEKKVVFTGDTLFSLGCGRVFEGTFEQMFESLNKIKSLPDDTKIYCGHEYTKNNLSFCKKYDSENKYLIYKEKWIEGKLLKKMPTVPITVKEEKDTNIFLRCEDKSIKINLGMNASSNEDIFKKLRTLKDNF